MACRVCVEECQTGRCLGNVNGENIDSPVDVARSIEIGTSCPMVDVEPGLVADVPALAGHRNDSVGGKQRELRAVDAADIDKKDTIKTLAEKYEALMKIYDAPNGITTRTTMTFNYADDAQSIANLISTYSPTKNLQENIKNGVDVGDKSGWGESSGSDTIITTYYKLLPYYDAFDHEYFRDMTAQYNYALGIVANYMESYNLYVSYAAQLIYAGAIDDLDVNERSKQMKVEKARNQAIENGVRDMLRLTILDNYERCKVAGKISVARKDAIDSAYTSYHALGGNGTITRVHEEIMEMPIV